MTFMLPKVPYLRKTVSLGSGIILVDTLQRREISEGRKEDVFSVKLVRKAQRVPVWC